MRKRRQQRQPAGRGGRRWWPVVVVTLLAFAVVGGLIGFGQGQQPERPRVALPSTGTVLGRPDAPVEIELWADFQCPACRAFALGPGRQLEETLIAQGRAKLVWRNFAFIGPESLWAAEAAACAGEQGQFWAYHDTLFAEQRGENRGAFSKENLKRFAAQLGLDTGLFNACLDTDRDVATVQAETAAGRQKGVRSTPTLFVNGRKIEGVPRFEELRQVIEAVAATAAAEGGS